LLNSKKKGDRARGTMLKEALDKAATSGLQKRLDRLAALDLRTLRDPDKVRAAREAVSEAETRLQEMLVLLVPDPADAPPGAGGKQRGRQIAGHLLAVRATQRQVNDATAAIAKAARPRPGQKLTTEEEWKLRDLAARQERILWDVSPAHALVADAGGVAVGEVLREMQSDMRVVQGRLGRGNVDPLTLAIQKDIDETLDEFVRALTRPLARGEKPPTARSITDTFPTILPDLCAIDEILFRAQKTLKSPQKR
ncbi:MAG TPA: hypothetical protein VKD72_26275, partial [Gemmataceae bacterium]|nr:hypothetical protein [Gemmataceae bacterium]